MQQAIDILDRLNNLKNRTNKDYEFAGESQRSYDKGQIDILEEIIPIIQALGDGGNDYLEKLEKAFIFMCSAYKDCSDTYRDPKNFKTYEQAMDSIMMFPMIQGTMNHIAIARISEKEPLIKLEMFSLVEINNILDKKYTLPLPPKQ